MLLTCAPFGVDVINIVWLSACLPAERLCSSYGASSSAAGSSSSSSRAYHYNVNTDWTHYESGSAGYTSTVSELRRLLLLLSVWEFCSCVPYVGSWQLGAQSSAAKACDGSIVLSGSS